MIADAHSLNPVNVLQMLRSLGSAPGKLYLIGCEPAILDIEDGRIGLSEVVEAAIPQAIQLIKSLINDLLSETAKSSKFGQSVGTSRIPVVLFTKSCFPTRQIPSSAATKASIRKDLSSRDCIVQKFEKLVGLVQEILSGLGKLDTRG